MTHNVRFAIRTAIPMYTQMSKFKGSARQLVLPFSPTLVISPPNSVSTLGYDQKRSSKDESRGTPLHYTIGVMFGTVLGERSGVEYIIFLL